MPVDPEWWRTFFEGPPVAFWLGTPTVAQTRLEADFVLDELEVSAPAELLDVPCGGGRHSRELSSRGFRMTGVDISTEFLRHARSNPAAAPWIIDWEERDMRDLPWSNRFDGAYSMGNSFGYLDDDGNAEFLRAVAEALRPGARFVLDTEAVAEILFTNLQERDWSDAAGIRMTAKRAYDPATSRLEVEHRWIDEVFDIVTSSTIRIYAYRELLGLMADAGFVDLVGYGSLAREPFRLGSKRLLLVGSKADPEADPING